MKRAGWHVKEGFESLTSRISTKDSKDANQRTDPHFGTMQKTEWIESDSGRHKKAEIPRVEVLG